MAIDTSHILVIESSPGKLLRLVALGVLMTAVAVWVAWQPAAPALVRIVGGYFGSVFFGLCTVVALWRLLTSYGPVVTISPEGIRDTRLAAAVIPWSAISDISTFEYRGQKSMLLATAPGVHNRLRLTPLARMTRIGNRALGINGLAISAADLKIDYDTLLKTCMEYARATRR